MTRPAVGQGVGSGVGGPAAGRKVDRVRWPSMIGPTMSPRKPTGRPVGRPPGILGPKRSLLLVRLRPDQAAALRRLAAKESEPGRRVDVSGLLRRIIDKALRLKAPTAE